MSLTDGQSVDVYASNGQYVSVGVFDGVSTTDPEWSSRSETGESRF